MKIVPCATHETDAGLLPGYDANVTLKPHSQPFSIKQPYNLHSDLEQEAKSQIELLIKAGWLKSSKSPWTAGVTFARKKTGGMRMCMEYRQLNLRIFDQIHNMPTSSELFRLKNI